MVPKRRLGTFIGWTIAIAFVASLLASLNPGGRAAGSRQPIDPRKLAHPEQVTGNITVWGWNIAAKSLGSIVPAFNKRYPHVAVNVEMTGASVQTRFLLSLSSGRGAPDVTELQSYETPRYIATRRMADLTAVAAKYRKDFPPASWANCVFEGKVYAIPWDIGPCGVFYKPELLERYGVDVSGIETWDDFIDAGKRVLQRSGGRTKMLPMSATQLQTEYEMLLQEIPGGQVFDEQGRIAIDSPQSRKVLTLMRKMLDAGICANVDSFTQEWMAGFNGDTIATYPGAVWLGGTIKDTTGEYGSGRAKWGVFPLPAFDRGGPHDSGMGGSTLVIPDQCPNKEAAFAFVEYALCTREAQVAQCSQYDIFPAYLPALADPFFQQPDPFYGGQKARALFVSVVPGIPVLNRTTDWVEAINYLSQSLTPWAVNHEDIDSTLKTLSNKLHRRLGRELAPATPAEFSSAAPADVSSASGSSASGSSAEGRNK